MSIVHSVRKILTLDCRQATELVSAAADGRLGAADRLALRVHLAICRPCRRFRRQLEQIRRWLSEPNLERHLDIRWEPQPADGPDTRLSDEARERLSRVIDEKTRDSP